MEVDMTGNVITIVILVSFIIYVCYENKHLEITQYTIRSKHIPKEFDGVRLVMLADLHNNKYGKDNKKLIEKVKEAKPDYILVAGDMVVSSEPDNLEIPYKLLSVLAEDYPIYYGLGNHEQRLLPDGTGRFKNYAEYKSRLTDLGVKFLENERITILRQGKEIAVTGLVIGMDYFKKTKLPEMTLEYIQNLVGIPENKWYNILIAHNPVYFKLYEEWGANLIVSGHLHGGIIRLPGLGGVISPQYKFMPKYDAGMFKSQDAVMLVSRGLGLHTIKLRINNKPELMVITLKTSDEKY
jgi:predicted MPP superfamily phosphohydrolase